MGGTGLEPTPKPSGKPEGPAQSGAESGALGARDEVERMTDPSLDAVVQAWPRLAEATRRAVLRLVEGGRVT